jgi:hypothetical protein
MTGMAPAKDGLIIIRLPVWALNRAHRLGRE